MPVTAEQQSLITALVDRIARFQEVVTRALPGNVTIREEFRIGAPAPTGAEETLALARAIEPAAREYKAILLQRGIDAASLSQFSRHVAELARLVAPVPAAATAPEARAPSVPPPERKPAAKRRKG
jgi:hypothetical protein